MQDSRIAPGQPVTVEIPLLLFFSLSLSPLYTRICVLFFHFISFLFLLFCCLALGDIHRDNVSLTRDNLRLFFSVSSGGSTNNNWDLFDRLSSRYQILLPDTIGLGPQVIDNSPRSAHTANFDLPSAPTNFLPSLLSHLAGSWWKIKKTTNIKDRRSGLIRNYRSSTPTMKVAVVVSVFALLARPFASAASSLAFCASDNTGASFKAGK